MLILGIDPGSRFTGYGVIEAAGSKTQFIDCGHIKTLATSIPERLKTIFEGIAALMLRYAFQSVAVEQVFFHRNADSALKLGQARGAAIAAVVSRGVPIFEYSARQVKQAVVGLGSADKTQVGHMVRRLLNLTQTLQEDAADALAVALCHSHTESGLKRLGGARGIVRGRLR